MCSAWSVLAKLPVCGAVKITVRIFILLIRTETHRPSAVSTSDKSGKDLRGSILHFTSAVFDLFLHLTEDIFFNDALMRVLNPNPFLFRLADALFVFVGNIGLLVVDAVADIGFIFE